jgi:hypothetical protein
MSALSLSGWNELSRPSREAIANLGVSLGQYAAEGDEGASTPAVIMPVSALTGQPGQQPRLEIVLAGKADVGASNRIDTSGSHKARWLARLVAILTMLIGLLFFLGMEASFEARRMIKEWPRERDMTGLPVLPSR